MSNLIKKIGKVYDRTMKTLGFVDKSRNSKAATEQKKHNKTVHVQNKGYYYCTIKNKI